MQIPISLFSPALRIFVYSVLKGKKFSLMGHSNAVRNSLNSCILYMGTAMVTTYHLSSLCQSRNQKTPIASFCNMLLTFVVQEILHLRLPLYMLIYKSLSTMFSVRGFLKQVYNAVVSTQDNLVEKNSEDRTFH